MAVAALFAASTACGGATATAREPAREPTRAAVDDLDARPVPPLPSLTTPKKTARPAGTFPGVLVPLPELALADMLPDLEQELRWPLRATSHPSLEPSFAIADAFAEPGIGWTELCARGGQHRQGASNRDLLAYLRAWCSARKGEVDIAVLHLGGLLRSTARGVAAAVRVDLVNIIANAGNADTAERLLYQHRIRDVAVLDLLAATYAELGQRQDARRLNQLAIGSDPSPSDEHTCRRLLKELVLAGSPDGGAASNRLRVLAGGKDPTCERLWAAHTCASSPARCQPYFELFEPRAVPLARVYAEWPTRPASEFEWLTIADRAAQALPLPGAVALALPALEAAFEAAPCKSFSRRRIGAIADRLRREPLTPDQAVRLHDLDVCP
jgi:hypothetical protein